MKSQSSWRNGWQFVCCTALPIAARMWVKKSGELMWPASSRRFWSFQAGSMLRKTPGVWETPYQPTPKPSPFVGSAPSRDERLWSTIEFVPAYSTSCMRMGEPEYASQRHIREVERHPRIPASSDPGEVSSRPHDADEVGLRSVRGRRVVLREDTVHELATAGDADLLEERLHVVAHRVRREVQLGCDLCRAQPACDRARHVELALGQAVRLDDQGSHVPGFRGLDD